MSVPVTHVYVNRPSPFGGTQHTTLCGRMALPTLKQSASHIVNCKLCLKKSSAFSCSRRKTMKNT